MKKAADSPFLVIFPVEDSVANKQLPINFYKDGCRFWHGKNGHFYLTRTEAVAIAKTILAQYGEEGSSEREH